MTSHNYIYEYYQQINDGTVRVGKWIRLIYEYIMKGLDEKRFYFDIKKANSAIEWIEAHTFHVEGPLAPGPFIMEVWEKALISCVFGIVDEKGVRVFREVLLLIGRKNGKSILASAIANYVFRQCGGSKGLQRRTET